MTPSAEMAKEKRSLRSDMTLSAEMAKEKRSLRSNLLPNAEMAKEQGSQRSDVSPKAPFLLRLNRLRRIAAILIAGIFLGGLSFAAYRAFSPAQEQQPAEESALNPQPSTHHPKGLSASPTCAWTASSPPSRLTMASASASAVRSRGG